MPDDLLHAYLAARDSPCPRCGYNLRGVQGSICPECGASIELTIGVSREQRWFPVAVVGFAGPCVYDLGVFADYLYLTATNPGLAINTWAMACSFLAFATLLACSVAARVRRWRPSAVRALWIAGGFVWALELAWLAATVFMWL